MPVGVAQVVNGTTSKITHHNYESTRQFTVQEKSQSQYENGELPSSGTTDYTLPWYDFGRDDKYIAINVLGLDLKLSERDAKFYLHNNSGGSLSFGSLSNGARYVLRFDALRRLNGSDGASITVYEYEDSMKSSNGEVDGAILQAYEANAAMILIPFN